MEGERGREDVTSRLTPTIPHTHHILAYTWPWPCVEKMVRLSAGLVLIGRPGGRPRTQELEQPPSAHSRDGGVYLPNSYVHRLCRVGQLVGLLSHST